MHTTIFASKFVWVFSVFLLTGLLAPNCFAQTMALTGATVIDGNGGAAIQDAVIIVKADRLSCVGTKAQCAVPDDAKIIELKGKFITPGLVDAHVHFSQTGWLDGRPDGMAVAEVFPYEKTAKAVRDNPARWHQAYLCSGITAVYDVGGHPWTTKLQAQSENNANAVHVRAAGPLITHAARPQLQLDKNIYSFLPMSSTEEVQTSMGKLVEMGASAVKVWYLAPRPKQREALDARMAEIGKAAQAAKLDLIVHATSLREAKVALRAGAVLLVHSVEDVEVDEEFLSLMKKNKAIYAPTLNVGLNWTKARASVIMQKAATIDDPNNCVDAATKQNIGKAAELHQYLPETARSKAAIQNRLDAAFAESELMAINLRMVRAAGITIATATDAGNPLTLHGPSIYIEMESMQATGIPQQEIIVMSTRNGAQAMNRLKDFGTLEAGKIADLIVLGEDPRQNVRAFRKLEKVMRRGVLKSQKELAQGNASSKP